MDSFTKHNILQTYRSGVLLEDIATAYNTTSRTIKRYAAAQRLPRRNKSLQDWERTAIAQAYDSGDKTIAIAAEFHIHPSHVRRIAKREGLDIRPVGRPKTHGHVYAN